MSVRGQGSSILSSASEGRNASPLSLADVTCLVDDDPAPRSEVRAVPRSAVRETCWIE